MDAANDSGGLKIAVAVLIPLTVILAAASYFLYSDASSLRARLDSEREAHVLAKRTADLAVRQYEEMRNRVGTKAKEYDAAKEEITANFKNVDERVNNLMSSVNAAVQAAKQNRAQGKELEDTTAQAAEGVRIVSQRAEQELYFLVRSAQRAS